MIWEWSTCHKTIGNHLGNHFRWSEPTFVMTFLSKYTNFQNLGSSKTRKSLFFDLIFHRILRPNQNGDFERNTVGCETWPVTRDSLGNVWRVLSVTAGSEVIHATGLSPSFMIHGPLKIVKIQKSRTLHLCEVRDRSWHFDDDRGPIICATAD